MRLAERNNLRETEGQQVAWYVDRLKLQIRDRIGVHVLHSRNEVKNITIKAKWMLYGKNSKFDDDGRSFGVNPLDKFGVKINRANFEAAGGDYDGKEDRAMGKRPVEVKDTAKQSNPYAKPILGKCYRCNQPGHRSNECSNRKSVNLVEIHKKKKKSFISWMGLKTTMRRKKGMLGGPVLLRSYC